MTPATENIVNGLTDKQLEMLCEVFSAGYFDQPAKVTADELARRASLSRSTFTEHLGKAENKVISNIILVLKFARKHEAKGKDDECGCK